MEIEAKISYDAGVKRRKGTKTGEGKFDFD